jgi:hypothetical protein
MNQDARHPECVTFVGVLVGLLSGNGWRLSFRPGFTCAHWPVPLNEKERAS